MLNAGNPLSLTVGQGSGSQVLTINPPTPAAVAEAINDSNLGLSAELRVIDITTGTVAVVVEGESGAGAALRFR